MIISASRRTDIPAFYSDWMINRIKAEYCTVFNPMNRSQIKYVSLKPEDVDVIVFWTKYSKPLNDKLNILDERGLKYYFQYTLTHYSRDIESKVPNFDLLKTEFKKLADKIGSDKIIWRYDPIIISEKYSFQEHIDLFGELAVDIRGLTKRVVISLVDYYKKTLRNLSLSMNSHSWLDQHPEQSEQFGQFINKLIQICAENNYEIQSCAEPIELEEFGIPPGKCIDDQLIRRTFGIEVTDKKDLGQRKECGCVKSIDIGVYDTCLHGCQYCYATKDHNSAINNFDGHDSRSPSLLGWHEAKPENNDTNKQIIMEF